MDCREAANLINADIDHEIDADLLAALDTHLSMCCECREAAQSTRTLNDDLRQAFRPHRGVADRVAKNVIETLAIKRGSSEARFARLATKDSSVQNGESVAALPRTDNPERRNCHPTAPALSSVKNEDGRPMSLSTQTESARRSRGRRSQWLSLVLSAAIGFLAAVVVFQPWESQQQAGQMIGQKSQRPPISRIARVVVATGALQTRKCGTSDWNTIPDVETFVCPTDTEFRTGPNIRCEMQTNAGCVIRLNDETEVALRTSRTVELKRGQIWCSSPARATLQVLAYDQSTSDQSLNKNDLLNQPICALSCPSNARLMTEVENDGKIQVTTASGDIHVQTKSTERLLKPGETATIVKGQVISATLAHEPILADRWMHSLLIRKGHRSDELRERVDQLLARVGRTKLSTLYEHEIRSLGEYCALPLLRYVQSPASRDDRLRRETGMRILADFAPSWAISDLIGLLSDSNAEVRFYAATALKRLTALTHGRAPEQWQADISENAECVERWDSWWQQNGQRYPVLNRQ